MVSAFVVEAKLPIPHDILWRVRASQTFMRFIVTNGALKRMESTPPRPVPSSPDAYMRVQTYVPANIAIPDIVRTVFDDSYIEISDTQTWDDVNRPFEQQFEIRPSVLADLVRSKGKLVLSPLHEADAGSENEPTTLGCRHVLSGECSVSIPFLGWYVEQAIISNMQNFYKDYPMHVKEFTEMVITRWGRGSDDLHVAVEKMLADEKEQM